MQTVNVPAGRLGIPEDDFQHMLDEACRRWHADQHNRYVAGVTAALTWVAGLRDEDPLTAQIRPASPDAQLRMRVSAAAIVMNTPDPVLDLTGTVHPEWAAGVERALAWVCGPDDDAGRPPQPPPLPSPQPGDVRPWDQHQMRGGEQDGRTAA